MEELTITFNDKKYILSDILFEKAPIYCKTCRTTRDIIKKELIHHIIFSQDLKIINGLQI